jgi:hypothetical protein
LAEEVKKINDFNCFVYVHSYYIHTKLFPFCLSLNGLNFSQNIF